MHSHNGEVAIVFGVITTASLHIDGLDFGGLMYRITFLFQLYVLRNVPFPFGLVRAHRTAERFYIHMTHYVNVEPRGSRRPERAVRTLEHLQINVVKKILKSFVQ